MAFQSLRDFAELLEKKGELIRVSVPVSPELEITEINNQYMLNGKLNATVLPRGTAWFDMGTFDSLQDAGNYVRILEQRQNLRISCLEEIAWRQNWINNSDLERLIDRNKNTNLGLYLMGLIR